MSYLLPGKRAKEIEALAQRHAFEYKNSDRSATRAFRLIAQAETRNVPENSLSGTMRDRSFVAFDLTYLEDLEAKRRKRPGQPWIPYDSPAQFTCVFVDLESAVPETILNPRSSKRLFNQELELDPKNKELAGLFQIWSEMPNMAKWLSEDKFLEFLKSTRGKFGFELNDGAVLCVASDVRATDVLGLIGMAVACANSLPQGLLQAFKIHGESQESSAPDSPAPDEPGHGEVPVGEAPEQIEGSALASSGIGDGATDSAARSAGPAKTHAATPTRGSDSTTPITARAVPTRAARRVRGKPTAGGPGSSLASGRSNGAGHAALPPPPPAEAWRQWLLDHPSEAADWGMEVPDPMAESGELPDWESMSSEERDSEIAELTQLAQDGLITREEYEEAMSYLRVDVN